MFVIETDLQGEALREANIKEPLEEPSGFALALRDWPQATRFGSQPGAISTAPSS